MARSIRDMCSIEPSLCRQQDSVASFSHHFEWKLTIPLRLIIIQVTSAGYKWKIANAGIRTGWLDFYFIHWIWNESKTMPHVLAELGTVTWLVLGTSHKPVGWKRQTWSLFCFAFINKGDVWLWSVPALIEPTCSQNHEIIQNSSNLATTTSTFWLFERWKVTSFTIIERFNKNCLEYIELTFALRSNDTYLTHWMQIRMKECKRRCFGDLAWKPVTFN